MTDWQEIPQTDFTDPDPIRLIATAYIDEPAMAPLADTAEDLAVLEALEGLTSRRRALAMPLPAGLPMLIGALGAFGLAGWRWKRERT